MIYLSYIFVCIADNQEGPRSLSLESSSSLESLVSENEEIENDHITLSQPVVLRNVRSTSVLRSGGSGAFTSYVRKRGEPDGRTAVTDSASASVKVAKSRTRREPFSIYFVLQKISHHFLLFFFFQSVPHKPSRRSIGNSGGGESDAAFTPSPPAPINDPARTLSHQSRIRSLYPTVNSVGSDMHPVLHTMYQRRPDSSSSASSATDWEGLFRLL